MSGHASKTWHEGQTVEIGVGGDLDTRGAKSTAHNLNTLILVEVLAVKVLESVKAAQEGHTTAGDDTLLDSSASGVECINNTVLWCGISLRESERTD